MSDTAGPPSLSPLSLIPLSRTRALELADRLAYACGRSDGPAGSCSSPWSRSCLDVPSPSVIPCRRCRTFRLAIDLANALREGDLCAELAELELELGAGKDDPDQLRMFERTQQVADALAADDAAHEGLHRRQEPR